MEFVYDVVAGKLRRIDPAESPDDYLDYYRPTKKASDVRYWTIIDDLPEHIPVTPAEIDIFQAYFGDLVEELLAAEPKKP